MTFNIHITRINENPTSGKSAKINKAYAATTKQSQGVPSLINVPAGHLTTKYPVQIFELQPQE